MRIKLPVRWITVVLLACAVTASLAPSQAKSAASLTPAQLTAAKSIGQRNAPITLEDFADFQCPMCRTLFMDTTRKVIQDYVSTGKVYLVHHDFPIPQLHPHAKEAAHWANAAAAIGKFEPVEDALYSHQDSWGSTGNIEGTLSSVLTPADLKKAKALMNDPEIDQAIQKDIELANSRGVNQTPSLFVTHKGQTVALPPGAISYPLLKQYLDYLLKQ